MFETGVVRVIHSARPGGIIGTSSRRSNEYTHYTIFNIRRKSPYIIPNLQLLDFLRDSRKISSQAG